MDVIDFGNNLLDRLPVIMSLVIQTAVQVSNDSGVNA